MTPEKTERKSRYTGFVHKSHYHRYFQGYTEARVKKPGGGYRLERVYTAPWKQHDLKGGQWAALKLLYALLALFALIATVVVMRQDVVSNYLWFVFLPGVICFLCAFLLCALTVSYITRRRRMTLWEFRSSSLYIRRAAAAACVTACVTAAAKLVCVAVFAAAGLSREWPGLVLLLASAASAGAIRRIERKVPYLDVPNDAAAPEDGVEIW